MVLCLTVFIQDLDHCITEQRSAAVGGEVLAQHLLRNASVLRDQHIVPLEAAKQ